MDKEFGRNTKHMSAKIEHINNDEKDQAMDSEDDSSYQASPKQINHASGTIDGDEQEADQEHNAFQLDSNNNVYWFNMADARNSEQESIDLNRMNHIPKARHKVNEKSFDGLSQFDAFTTRGSKVNQNF